MPKKRKPKKKSPYSSRRMRAWQLIFVLFLVLIIPLFVFVVLQTSRSQQILGAQTYEKVGE